MVSNQHLWRAVPSRHDVAGEGAAGAITLRLARLARHAKVTEAHLGGGGGGQQGKEEGLGEWQV